MNWKKRVRKIAENNPSALHSTFKQSIADDPAWYRVEWNEDDIHKTNSAKMLQLIFRWLKDKRLLSQTGLNYVKNTELNQELPSSLNRSFVTSRAEKFLDSYFDDWFDIYGINLIISLESGNRELIAFEEFWTNWLREDLS